MTSPAPPRLDTHDTLVRWTTLVYALHAFSIATGIVGAATVIGAFLTGWPSILAVILNYVKRGEARGTWLESRIAWQIRTAHCPSGKAVPPGRFHLDLRADGRRHHRFRFHSPSLPATWMSAR